MADPLQAHARGHHRVLALRVPAPELNHAEPSFIAAAFLAPALLASCKPAAELWVGVCALDDGGAFEFDVSIDRTSGNTVAGDATMSCGETTVSGPFGGTDMTIGGPASRRNYQLGADDPNVHWQLYLAGDVADASFGGECMLLWSAETDYSGDTMPTECTGSGEFTATAAN